MWRETIKGRPAYIARRLTPGSGPHTVVTPDLAELCSAMLRRHRFTGTSSRVTTERAGTLPSNPLVLDETEAARRTEALARLQAALHELGVRSVLVGKHRLVLHYNQQSCPPSGLTDPELRIFIAGRQTTATTDGARYRLGNRHQLPATDPAAAAARICRTRPPRP